jgi:hypothetical protein
MSSQVDRPYDAHDSQPMTLLLLLLLLPCCLAGIIGNPSCDQVAVLQCPSLLVWDDCPVPSPPALLQGSGSAPGTAPDPVQVSASPPQG